MAKDYFKGFDYPSMGDKIDEGRKVEGGVEKEARGEQSVVDGGNLTYPKMEEQQKAKDAAFKKSNPRAHAPTQPDYVFDYPSMEENAPLQHMGLNDESQEDSGASGDSDSDNDSDYGDPEERELIELAESGQVDEFADRISEDLLEMGASQKDLDMVDYFREVADGNDPAWQKWGRDMALWIRQSKKAMGK